MGARTGFKRRSRKGTRLKEKGRTWDTSTDNSAFKIALLWLRLFRTKLKKKKKRKTVPNKLSPLSFFPTLISAFKSIYLRVTHKMLPF